MAKINLRIRYTNQKKNTELDVAANYESSEQQNDQSPKDMIGLVIDYLPLAVIELIANVPVILDTVSNMI
ncbi:hypothetical protein [Photobacterium leiognathi]|uniref:hypothetical protein n=1 Tax=Photobacterium leiognathi TaxID=553611 RepID=UPI002981EB8C|nr:hypothetical protein [Photobacterium leiognathi]